MLRFLLLSATFLVALSPAPTTVSPPTSGLADLLAGVPDTAAAREQPVGYVDFRAVEQALPLRYLSVGGPAWPTLVGFDFFDVDREISFGSPPSDGLLLGGMLLARDLLWFARTLPAVN